MNFIYDQFFNLFAAFGAPATTVTFKPPAPSYKSFQDPSSESEVYSQNQIYNLGKLWSHSPAVTANECDNITIM